MHARLLLDQCLSVCIRGLFSPESRCEFLVELMAPQAALKATIRSGNRKPR